MCLYVNQEATNRFKKANRVKELTVYKVLRYDMNRQYCTPYRNKFVELGQELVAENHETMCVRDGNGAIHSGAIHVFLKLSAAKDCARYGTRRVIVKCKAKASDFIAKGSTSKYFGECDCAAFKAITIPDTPNEFLCSKTGMTPGKPVL